MKFRGVVEKTMEKSPESLHVEEDTVQSADWQPASLTERFGNVIQTNLVRGDTARDMKKKELETKSYIVNQNQRFTHYKIVQNPNDVFDIKVFKTTRPNFFDKKIKKELIGEELFYKNVLNKDATDDDLPANLDKASSQQTALKENLFKVKRAAKASHIEKSNKSQPSMIQQITAGSNHLKKLRCGYSLGTQLKPPTADELVQWAIDYANSHEDKLIENFLLLDAQLKEAESRKKKRWGKSHDNTLLQNVTAVENSSLLQSIEKSALSQGTMSAGAAPGLHTGGRGGKPPSLAQQLEHMKNHGTQTFLNSVTVKIPSAPGSASSRDSKVSVDRFGNVIEPTKPKDRKREVSGVGFSHPQRTVAASQHQPTSITPSVIATATSQPTTTNTATNNSNASITSSSSAGNESFINPSLPADVSPLTSHAGDSRHEDSSFVSLKDYIKNEAFSVGFNDASMSKDGSVVHDQPQLSPMMTRPSTSDQSKGGVVGGPSEVVLGKGGIVFSDSLADDPSSVDDFNHFLAQQQSSRTGQAPGDSSLEVEMSSLLDEPSSLTRIPSPGNSVIPPPRHTDGVSGIAFTGESFTPPGEQTDPSVLDSSLMVHPSIDVAPSEDEAKKKVRIHEETDGGDGLLIGSQDSVVVDEGVSVSNSNNNLHQSDSNLNQSGSVGEDVSFANNSSTSNSTKVGTSKSVSTADRIDNILAIEDDQEFKISEEAAAAVMERTRQKIASLQDDQHTRKPEPTEGRREPHIPSSSRRSERGRSRQKQRVVKYSNAKLAMEEEDGATALAIAAGTIKAMRKAKITFEKQMSYTISMVRTAKDKNENLQKKLSKKMRQAERGGIQVLEQCHSFQEEAKFQRNKAAQLCTDKDFHRPTDLQEKLNCFQMEGTVISGRKNKNPSVPDLTQQFSPTKDSSSGFKSFIIKDKGGKNPDNKEGAMSVILEETSRELDPPSTIIENTLNPKENPENPSGSLNRSQKVKAAMSKKLGRHMEVDLKNMQVRSREKILQQQLDRMMKVRWFVSLVSRFRDFMKRMNNFVPMCCLKLLIILQQLIINDLELTLDIFYFILEKVVVVKEDHRKAILYVLTRSIREVLYISAEEYLLYLQHYGYPASAELMNEIRENSKQVSRQQISSQSIKSQSAASRRFSVDSTISRTDLYSAASNRFPSPLQLTVMFEDDDEFDAEDEVKPGPFVEVETEVEEEKEGVETQPGGKQKSLLAEDLE